MLCTNRLLHYLWGRSLMTLYGLACLFLEGLLPHNGLTSCGGSKWKEASPQLAEFLGIECGWYLFFTLFLGSKSMQLNQIM